MSLEQILEMITPEPTTGCWLWTRSLNNSGYAQARFGGRMRLVHRVLFGTVPTGKELDHLCRVRCCVNPAHLEPVTRKTNLARGAGSGGKLYKPLERCKRGHPRTPDNVYDDGRCRTCAIKREREARLA